MATAMSNVSKGSGLGLTNPDDSFKWKDNLKVIHQSRVSKELAKRQGQGQEPVKGGRKYGTKKRRNKKSKKNRKSKKRRNKKSKRNTRKK